MIFVTFTRFWFSTRLNPCQQISFWLVYLSTDVQVTVSWRSCGICAWI